MSNKKTVVLTTSKIDVLQSIVEELHMPRTRPVIYVPDSLHHTPAGTYLGVASKDGKHTVTVIRVTLNPRNGADAQTYTVRENYNPDPVNYSSPQKAWEILMSVHKV